VENALHWILDVTFSGEALGSTREDDSRVRDRTLKASVRGRRKKTAWNKAYVLKLLVG